MHMKLFCFKGRGFTEQNFNVQEKMHCGRVLQRNTGKDHSFR
jgi:hypothetical protein